MADRLVDRSRDDLAAGLDLIDSIVEPIVTVCGSARTPQDHALSLLAQEVAASLAQAGWVVLTGAGPGIMEAASRGASEASSLGVNIELPFEHGTNQHVAPHRQVTMRHFFTRKVVMTRKTKAFVFFPGGVGTLDELFEVLTLLFTAKLGPLPVVLVDEPGGTFWTQWMAFMADQVIGEGYLSPADDSAWALATSPHEVHDLVTAYYANYQGFFHDDGAAELRLRHLPTEANVAEARTLVPDVTASDRTLHFSYAGRSYASLCALVAMVNRWVA